MFTQLNYYMCPSGWQLTACLLPQCHSASQLCAATWHSSYAHSLHTGWALVSSLLPLSGSLSVSLCSSSHCLHVSDINVVCIGRNENNFWTFCGSVSIAKSFRRCFIHSFPNEFKINSIFCSSQFYLPWNLMCFVDKLGILYKLRMLNMICSTCVASSSFPFSSP